MTVLLDGTSEHIYVTVYYFIDLSKLSINYAIKFTVLLQLHLKFNTVVDKMQNRKRKEMEENAME